jgi:hypothetical protein
MTSEFTSRDALNVPSNVKSRETLLKLSDPPRMYDDSSQSSPHLEPELKSFFSPLSASLG